MPSPIVVSSRERPVLGFALQRVVTFYSSGTREQRDTAASLSQMLAGLETAPEGGVEVEFLAQDAYLLGIRLFYTSVELEELWLDACEQAKGHEVEPPDPDLKEAVSKYFPDLIAGPLDWNFDQIRGLFTDLGFKLDRSVTELEPRARAMYNSDREEMSNKAIAVREANLRQRQSQTGGTVAIATPDPPVATAVRPDLVSPGWGVEFSTGLSQDDIPLNSFRVLMVGSVRVLITRYGGELGAIDGTCTHQQANLTKGHVDGTALECPRHGATFDLRSGEELCPPFCQKWMDSHGMIGSFLALVTPDKKGGDLRRYPIRVENGEIILRV